MLTFLNSYLKYVTSFKTLTESSNDNKKWFLNLIRVIITVKINTNWFL